MLNRVLTDFKTVKAMKDKKEMVTKMNKLMEKMREYGFEVDENTYAQVMESSQAVEWAGQ